MTSYKPRDEYIVTSYQLTSVLGSTVHGNHPSALFGGVILLDGVVHGVGQLKFLERFDHVLVQRVVHRHVGCDYLFGLGGFT